MFKNRNHYWFNCQHNCGDLCDHLISMRNFTLTMNKIFIQAPKITRKMATNMIQNWQSSHTSCVFHILREVGAELKIVHSRHAYLSTIFKATPYQRYTLTCVMSPFGMSLPLLYLKTLGKGCAQFKSPFLLSHLPLIYHGFNIKIIHQRIPTTRSHTSRCHHCHIVIIAMLTLCYSIMSHATLIPCYQASMLTLETSLILHALWFTCMILERLEFTKFYRFRLFMQTCSL